MSHHKELSLISNLTRYNQEKLKDWMPVLLNFKQFCYDRLFFVITDGWWYQNGWIFGKVSKGGVGHFQSKNLYCRFWTFIQGFKEGFSGKNCNMIFRKWGGGVKCRLKFFRKFIRFGTATRPFRLTSDRWMTWPLSLDTSARSSDKGGRGKKVVTHIFIEISGFSWMTWKTKTPFVWVWMSSWRVMTGAL